MNPPATPDRASLLTPAGRGAVAVIAAEGRAFEEAIAAHFQAANGRPLEKQAVGRVVFGHWRTGDHAEEVLLCPVGEAQFEVHCHGGAAAAERILDALAGGGAHIEAWRVWQLRGAADALGGEATVALSAATTRRAATVLLDQQAGALRQVVDAALDDLATNRLESARARLADALLWAPLGQRLVEPWHVALAGEPNVGKSCLLNAIVGYQRAIVFDQPGTTRDVLAATTAIDGWPVRLTDAAGIRATDDALEAAGVSLARKQLTEADLVLWILDATELAAVALSDPRRVAAEALAAVGGDASARLLPVVNKIDLVEAISPPIGVKSDDAEPSAAFVSALTGAGLDALLAALGARLVPAPPPPGQAMPINARQAALLTLATASLDQGAIAEATAALRQLTAPNAGVIAGE